MPYKNKCVCVCVSKYKFQCRFTFWQFHSLTCLFLTVCHRMLHKWETVNMMDACCDTLLTQTPPKLRQMFKLQSTVLPSILRWIVKPWQSLLFSFLVDPDYRWNWCDLDEGCRNAWNRKENSGSNCISLEMDILLSYFYSGSNHQHQRFASPGGPVRNERRVLFVWWKTCCFILSASEKINTLFGFWQPRVNVVNCLKEKLDCCCCLCPYVEEVIHTNNYLYAV